jgi:hypothetical protein
MNVEIGLWTSNSFSGDICFKFSVLVHCNVEPKENSLFSLSLAALQRKNANNLKQILPEKEYRGLSPNFHIHVSVSELYFHDGAAVSAGGNMWTDPGNI